MSDRGKIISIGKKMPQNKILGGLAQSSTIGDLAKMHGVTLKQIINQLVKGTKIEKEHTSNVEIAVEIAFDHIYEDPNYYDKLEK